MYCSHCGKEIPDNSKFCPNCGSLISVTTAPPSSYPAGSQRVYNSRDFRQNNAKTNYAKVILIISCVVMLIAMFFPVLKITYYYDSEGKSIIWLAEQELDHSVAIVILFALTEIFSLITLISQLNNSDDMERFGSFTGIATFVAALIYYITLDNYGTNDYYIANFTMGAGPITMLLFSIIILIFSILKLIQKNNMNPYSRGRY